MEFRIQTLAFVVSVFAITNVSSTCLSSTMQNVLRHLKSNAESAEKHLAQCDRDDDFKKPMKSIRRHMTKVAQDVKLINSIYHKRQWTKHNGHCYYFSRSLTGWKYAQVQCEQYHARLVKIDDKEEERWLQNKIENQRQINRNRGFIKRISPNNVIFVNNGELKLSLFSQKSFINNYWIDMKAKIDKFYWTQDNTKPTFVSFEKGYPQSYDTDSHCVFLIPNKKWMNGVCNTSKQFICESDLCY